MDSPRQESTPRDSAFSADGGTATCAMGIVGIAGNMSGCADTCRQCTAIAARRVIAPMSTSFTSTRRPTLQGQHATGIDGTHAHVCCDRACTMVLANFDASGSSGA